jgi:O-acetylserine/cysteine efflux transporter
LKPYDVFVAIVVPVLWALGFAAAKAGMGQIPPILLMAIRFAIAGAVLVWFVRPPWHLMRRIFAVACVSATVPYSSVFTGLSHLDASTAILVVQSEIPFMALLAVVWLKEKMSARKLAGMVVAFAGIALITGQPDLQSGVGWIMLVIVGGFVWAIGQIMIRRIGPLVDGLTLIAWVAVFTAPQLVVSSFVFEDGQWQALASADWKSWAIVLYMGLIMTALGYALWYSLLGRCEVVLAAPFLLLQPVIGVLAAVLFLGEEPTWITLVGGAVVVLGIAFVTLERPKIPATGTTPEAPSRG